MSAFGYDNFKADMIDEVIWRAKDRKLSKKEAIVQLLQVIEYMLEYGEDWE
jgi:predicted metal-dependent hydrolase